MSDNANAAVEVAEEAVEQKLEALNISEDNSKNSEEKARKRVRLPTTERIRIWEEEQKGKVVIKSGLKGTVKWYSVLGRYGFIAREDEGDDVFVHQTAISKSATNKFYLRTLADNEEVVFDLVEGKKGPEAANVSGPDGDNVLGSRFRHLLLSRFRNNRKPRRSDAEPNVEEEAKKEENGVEESKKPKKHRKNRKNNRREKAAGDAPEQELSAGARRKDVDEPEQTKIADRCGSGNDEPNLGAQAVDAQI